MPHLAEQSRFTLGGTTITYLPDGYGAHHPDTMMPGVDWAAHPGSLADSLLVLTFGAFLVRTGDQNILVDLALGEMDVDIPGVARLKGGELLRSLAAEGLSADDIDTVVYTHLHLDHVGWTSDVAPVPNGPRTRTPTGLTFARARHLMAQDEWRYWSARTGELGGPDADVVLKPLEGVVEFIGGGDTIAPGVTVEDTSGHTPGHLAVVVRDPSGAGRESVFLAGDIFHAPVEIADPNLSFSSDVDPDRAKAVRDRVLERPDTVIAAGHFPHGVFGRAVPTGDTYTWTTVDGSPSSR
ncbi:MBL fold metallo-hydrolase [Streptomyces sp. NPDC048417]|uniref:MBL fold metallo-hydrolase n=1 Tax=Streptomyces sp. NPDC048417 TaxID=3155387 RepID=UPI0034126603